MNTNSKFYLIVFVSGFLILGSIFSTVYYIHSSQAKESAREALQTEQSVQGTTNPTEKVTNEVSDGSVKTVPGKSTPSSTPPPTKTQPAPKPSTTTYSASLVATHNTQSDCWIIIQGKIYSVSSFMSSHPGGVSAIASNCGTDVTTLFTTSAGHRHSSYAYSLLPTYFVADLGSTGTSVSATNASSGTIAPPPTRSRNNDDD